MSLSLTPQQISDLLNEARRIIKEDKNVGGILKDKLYSNEEKIQSILNAILAQNGVATQQQLDELDERIRIQKVDLLNARLLRTKRTFLIVVISAAVGFGLLYYFTRQKTA